MRVLDILGRIRRGAVAVAMVGAGLVPAVRAAAEPAPVTGRIVVRLTEAGARALRAGNLDLPRPAGAETVRPRLEPLFRTPTGALGRFAVLTFVPDRVAHPEVSDNAPWLAALAADPRVEGASPDAAFALSELPDDPYLLGDGGLPNQFPIVNPGGLSTNAAEAWPFVPYGRWVPVAIVDSGVDWLHPDIGGPAPPGGVLWINQAERNGAPGVDDDHNGHVDDVIGWDFVNASNEGYSVAANEDGAVPDNDPRDYAGHGTQVAGLVTAITDNGVGIAGTAREFARIMPVRAGWEQANGGAVVFMSYCAQAIEYAALMGARVMNGSWDSRKCQQNCPADEWGLEAALDFAINEHDMVVVGSAGNQGAASTTIEYMAMRPDVLGVAGVRPDGIKANGSNYGSWVSLAAFWSDMPTTAFNHAAPVEKSTYTKVLGGTSFSAPQVAGAAAVCRAAAPEASAATIRDVLVGTAHDLSALDPTHPMGGGLVDIAAAVESLTGGWDAAGNGTELARWTPGKAALNSTIHQPPFMCVIDAAGGPLGSCYAPEEVTLPPVTVRGFPHGTYLVRIGHDEILPVSPGLPQPPGFPQVVPPDRLTQLVAADLDGDGVEEILCVDDDLFVFDSDGTKRVVGKSAGGDPWDSSRIAVGDFEPSLPGLEIVGVSGNGKVTALDASLQPIPNWSRTLPGTGPAGFPSAVEVGGSGLGTVFALMALVPLGQPQTATQIHAFRGEEDHLTMLPGVWTSITPLGFADGTKIRLAVGGATQIALLAPDLIGNPGLLDLGGPLAGEPLCADVDGDYDADVIALRRDGVLMAWHQDRSPVSGFPRTFPVGFSAGPMVVDDDAAAEHPTRRILLSADDGSLWSLPVGGWGRPAPWPNLGGDAGRTRFLGFARATPVRATAALRWEWAGDSGRACWTLSGETSTVMELRLTLPGAGGREVWSGSPEARCADVAGVSAGARLGLEARDRDGVWTTLGVLLVPGPSPLVLLPAYPNPFRESVALAYHVDAGAPAELTVVDAAGRLLHRADLDAGGGVYRWDGRDASGRPVAAGSYFARLRQGSEERRVRFLRVP